MDQFNGFVKSAELTKAEGLTSSIDLLKASEQLLIKSKEALALLEDESLEQTIVDLETQISNIRTRITSISNLKTIIVNAINKVESERLALIAQNSVE